ncbi:MAG: cobalt transport protein CbiN [Caloramator sp.]|uniref:Cobalt transport protein CbiN n=1 Tax=Caloramator proteoclasticus DSM 10124 TaxID=1121262 RepID=A0A1M4S8E2_9CLOT|nr:MULTISPECIES: energy-coupling factor ABC transporter substrate-binding protein [Caloramator]GIW48647.1 MAG: cobalt transport protein CbiN [Caloramator sp.]SHE28435.1 cobalt/nickel transport protein [Caloramator proteoclasticus DSM 10124]
MNRKNVFLLSLCAFLVVISLFVGSRGGEFGGADDLIEERIVEIDENYKPWFNSVWEPPSGEIESLLFALQAGLGAYFIGYYVGRKKNVKECGYVFKK